MCVYMYLCVCVCMHVLYIKVIVMRAVTRLQDPIGLYTQIVVFHETVNMQEAWLHARGMHTCMYVFMYARVYVRMYVRMYIRMYVYIRVYVSEFVFVNI
jgi:hypothetical protein